jgi:ornithine cyclodeaminase/alanine dehydrogenase-like protein (mu-crystallin family)
MALCVSEQEVRSLLSMPAAIEAVEEALGLLAEGRATNHPRRRHRAPGGLLHVMDAAMPTRGVMGLKAYTTFRDANRFHVMLYSTETGALLALIEADWLGRIRTGAATGVAVRRLARPDAAVVGILGSGRQARTQVEAVRAVRHVREVRAWSRTRENLRAFCDELGARPVESPRAAVEGADIVVTATPAREPILQGAWTAPGQCVVAMGSNHASRRELDEAAVRRADLIATDDIDQARIESGELIHAGVDWTRVLPLARARRADDRQVTLFKSNGIALEDVAAARVVWEAAAAKGLGRPLPL